MCSINVSSLGCCAGAERGSLLTADGARIPRSKSQAPARPGTDRERMHIHCLRNDPGAADVTWEPSGARYLPRWVNCRVSAGVSAARVPSSRPGERPVALAVLKPLAMGRRRGQTGWPQMPDSLLAMTSVVRAIDAQCLPARPKPGLMDNAAGLPSPLLPDSLSLPDPANSPACMPCAGNGERGAALASGLAFFARETACRHACGKSAPATLGPGPTARA